MQALAPASGAEPLAAAAAPGGQHLAASRGLAARAKSVTALAHQPAGLIGPLHELSPFAVACGLYGPSPWASMRPDPVRRARGFASIISEMLRFAHTSCIPSALRRSAFGWST